MRYANLCNWLKLFGATGRSKPAHYHPMHKEGLEPAFLYLRRRYSERHRFYHTLKHIDHCLRELKKILDKKRKNRIDFDRVELAIWFHDVVYNPMAKDNEERSANFARRVMFSLDPGMSDVFIKRVQKLILATKHIAIPMDTEAALITDIDLSSLGASEAVFDANREAIRKEYADLSDVQFEKGNQAFLKTLLSRPLIFSLPYFQDKYEAQARRNIVRILQG